MWVKKPDVLVLNKSYTPIQICSWQKAMALIYQDAARAIDREFITYKYEDWLKFSIKDNSYPSVFTVDYKVNIPEIILLRRYNRLPTKDVKYSRQSLFARDNFTCGYCNKKFDRRRLTVDHIIPKSRGGATTWMNTMTCCIDCNRRKADNTPKEAKMALYIVPTRPAWINPIGKVVSNRQCESWKHFATRVDDERGDKNNEKISDYQND